MARGYTKDANTSREELAPSTTPKPSITPDAAALSLQLPSESLTPPPTKTKPTSASEVPTASTQPSMQPSTFPRLPLHPSSRAATTITILFQERFVEGILYIELGPSGGLGLKKCVWDPALPMLNVWDAWEDRVSIQMRDFMGDIRRDGKRPSCIEERH
ncbi:hypothetical protein M9H77_30610 [Catharanthus roseus]|uniref:Uncharacterized protein n=1 Tax=Catharanthus roseus TaxID=4058 RepID=A0ACC0A215_CATRO|nr:hypothetical protein M9H77_30610 [Catharanthus roseus]